jgi:hypothetical protein
MIEPGSRGKDTLAPVGRNEKPARAFPSSCPSTFWPSGRSRTSEDAFASAEIAPRRMSAAIGRTRRQIGRSTSRPFRAELGFIAEFYGVP